MPSSTRKTSGVARKRKPHYKSKFEVTVAAALEKCGLRLYYESVKLPYTLELEYTPDWVNAGNIVLEAKGKFDYDSRRKMLAVKKAHPCRDIRMVFMRNNKLGKGSKMRYGEWCDKHGIRWSVYPELPFDKKEMKSV